MVEATVRLFTAIDIGLQQSSNHLVIVVMAWDYLEDT